MAPWSPCAHSAGAANESEQTQNANHELSMRLELLWTAS
jgi:hypothetical protein